MEFTKVQIGLFDGKNWSTWKYKMCILLRSIPGALEVVEGNLQSPKMLEPDATKEEKAKYDLDLATFTKADSSALIVITTNMTEETLQKVMRFTTARDVWLELHRLYDGISEDKAYDLCLEFFGYRRDSTDDISSHLSKLKNLWNDLKLEISKDTKSNCNLPELFLICKMLGTLPEEYFSFKSSWMLMGKSERTIDNLTTQLCAYEKALNGRNVQNCSEALAIKSERRVNNHIRKSDTKSKKAIVCHYCKQSGHKVRQCVKWKADGRPAKSPSQDTSNFSKSEKGDSGVNMGLMTFCQANVTETSDDCWYVDNGATNHVTFRDDLFQTFEPFLDSRVMTTANGESICALGKGTIEVEAAVNGKWKRYDLLDVWYVPNIKKNLFSVLATQDLHLKSEFISRTETCFLKVDGDVKLFGSRCRKGGLYKLALRAVKPSKPLQVNALTSDENLLQIYHERLGHQNKRHVKATVERELGVRLRLDSELCEGCVFGKSHRLKFGTRERATKPGELIHTDVCGPFAYSMSGLRYFALFKDDFSRYRQVYFMKQKSEVPEKLKQFLAETRITGNVVKEVLSDNGGEFNSGIVRQILQEHGIKQRLTMPYTPEQNGCSERDNRTLVETARAMMHAHETIPQGLWAEMINTSAYILNRTGPSSIPEKTPIELWTGKKPSIKHLRIIGCTCYAHIPKPKRTKMDKKAVKGVLIGYDNDDGYRIWCKEKNTLIRSRDVVFHEESLVPGKVVALPRPGKADSTENTSPHDEEDETIGVPDPEDEPEEEENQTPRYDLRKREDIKIPKRMDDYVMSAMSNINDIHEPQLYSEAIQCQERDKWKKAMNVEMEDCKPETTPIIKGNSVGKVETEEKVKSKEFPYQRVCWCPEGKLEVKHTPSEFQLADCLTKPQHKPRLKTLCDAMGLKSQD